MRNPEAEAERSFVLLAERDVPLAGAHVLAPSPEADEQSLYLSHLWFEQDPRDLAQLLHRLLAKFPHEAAYAPLYNFHEPQIEQLEPVFAGLDFVLEQTFQLEFPLAELPPLGLPLVLEAWADESDGHFRKVYAAAEGYTPSERYWAWLKRWRSPFTPDLWFIARETLDQDPVGYAFYGRQHGGVEGVYYLTAVGALAEHRGSSEMLRRLLLSSMHELAARSPFGHIKTYLTGRDETLIRIFESLGFVTRERHQQFVRRPR